MSLGAKRCLFWIVLFAACNPGRSGPGTPTNETSVGNDSRTLDASTTPDATRSDAQALDTGELDAGRVLDGRTEDVAVTAVDARTIDARTNDARTNDARANDARTSDSTINIPVDARAADVRANDVRTDGLVVIPPPTSPTRIFYLGHSLVGEWMPAMVQDMVASIGIAQTYLYQVGIGAPLSYQYTNPQSAQGVNATQTISRNAFDVFLLTEAVPLADQIRYNDTMGYAQRYVNEARQGNPNVQPYVYEVWDFRRNGDAAWRTQIVADRSRWESIVDTLNRSAPGNRPVLMIPGGTAMRVLSERIEAGRVPGITNLQQLFVDQVHLNAPGWYFMSCVMYATLYRRTPVGLTAVTSGPGATGPNGTYTQPPAASIATLQTIAWEVVSTDLRSGVR